MTIHHYIKRDLPVLAIAERYREVREASLAMVRPLHTEDFIPQPEAFVSPPRWNLGHTTWFFEEFILSAFQPDYRRFHPVFAHLFNSYYNSVGDRTPRQQRGALSRPTVQDIFQYRDYVDGHMMDFLNSGHGDERALSLTELGIHHEQQHQELFFTDLKYTFHLNPLFPAYSDIAYCEEHPEGTDGFLSIPGGLYEIGHEGTAFCFDNEKQRHSVYLNPFRIQKRLITNGEFIEFISDGGYEKFLYWHEEGWAWKRERGSPMYWQLLEDGWYQYTLAGLRPLQPDHILTHINYYEASAFARWKGCRLPTEFEWEAASDRFRWGQRWEWTGSAYLPYPGFRIADDPTGEYNGKFMVNQKVLRGASVVTPPGHERKTYRNFFHPDIGYQFNGIRLAEDEDHE